MFMQAVIKNSEVEVAVKHHGAELCGMKTADGVEHIWQADREVWGRHAPNLFPIVGALKGGTYKYEGKEYSLNQHGFARDRDFELVERTDAALTYELGADEETRVVYPFEFVFRVLYRLEGTCLSVNYIVENRGDVIMPFSVGAHPGFGFTWSDDDRLEDFYLEFEKEENLDRLKLDENKLLSDKTEPCLRNSRKVLITRDIFDQDALILIGLESSSVSLCSGKHDRRLTVDYPGFPMLGVWAKPGAPFVCIEPWYGHVDPAGVDGDIMHKPGIIRLEAGKKFSCTYRIGIQI